MRTGLPIDEALPRVRDALRASACVVLEAPPGAGKSTIVPLALLGSDWLGGARILMLEPRRLAARAVATRMATLLGESVGATVGYRVRLESRVSAATRIEVVTEGILTRMLQDDPALSDVGCVIFDEFHERSLAADLGLALCLDAQAALRPQLRLLVMSATLDSAGIAAYLGDAPLVAVAGRTHPVETRHVPRAAEDQLEVDVAAATRRVLREDVGDVLVFLPGSGVIERVRQQLTTQGVGAADVLPLYGELSQVEQDRALAPVASGRRKVILATNIAETSLTIAGVRAVIDSGYARRARFDPATGMSRLVTERISLASADQRRGRAGREGPGLCVRLWSADVERALMPFTPPEIVDADLAALALELAAWGVGDPGALRWLTAPSEASYAQARDLLRLLGAIDAHGCITAHGRAMVRTGTHPRLAHMLIRGAAMGLRTAACDIAALLSERDLMRTAPSERRADLRLRVEALHGDDGDLPPLAEVDRQVRARARRLAQSWRESLDDGTSGNDLTDATGVLLTLAYPDRVALRRSGARGRYLLANGRGALLPESDPLAREELLAVATVAGGARDDRIALAAPVARDVLMRCLADDLVTEEFIGWDPSQGAVVATSRRRLGELVLEERPLSSPDPERVCAAMLAGVRQIGLDALPWSQESKMLRARLTFLHRHRALDAGQWPDVSDEALTSSVERWLAPYLAAISRRDHLRSLPLVEALLSMLDADCRRRLDELAPSRIEIPSGTKIVLVYPAEEAPVLAARLQELFGMVRTPTVLAGRIPVVVHILSPAGRPVQVTRDLASFWRSGYAEVRKELKGRYPRHYWPEDPLQAQATRRVRPR